jgi:hypothetical protein
MDSSQLMAVVMGIGGVAQATTAATSYNLSLMLRSIAPAVRCVSKHEWAPSFETRPRPKAGVAPQDED